MAQKPKQYREGLPEVPQRMKYLRVDARGYPVPWFVHWVDGKPDFRVIREHGIPTAYQKKLCWICGTPLGSMLAFTIGPIASISRVHAEPPSHRECAEFAVRACPFMLLPKAQHRDANLPAEAFQLDGFLKRNPGVFAIYVCSAYRPFKVAKGVLFELGSPLKDMEQPVGDRSMVYFYSEGRAASRLEVVEALRAAMPYLIEAAKKDGAVAVSQLSRQYQAALTLLPPGDPVAGIDTDEPVPFELAPGASPLEPPVSTVLR